MSSKTKFQAILEEEINKVKGIYYPVKAGFFRRAIISKAYCSELLPNPNDEFCFPDIGPNYEIISHYAQDYLKIINSPMSAEVMNSGIREPIMVEKTRPDGYMILNGHHRWAAALQVGMKKLQIKIVDLTQEEDIRKMLGAARSDKRISLDLDEAVFGKEGDEYLEKALPFPLNRIYKERVRLGIPALFNALKDAGYDIWIYTARYYSADYLNFCLRHYHALVTGIVTGTARKGPPGSDTMKELEKRMNAKYDKTVHIDNESVIVTTHGSRDFKDYRLSGSAASWSREVLDILMSGKAFRGDGK